MFMGVSANMQNVIISLAGALLIKFFVYEKGKNAKNYRKGIEYGSARWGTSEDWKPFADKEFQNNVILTETERLMMESRPPDIRHARNKNIMVIGGSGCGKTFGFIKPNILQMNTSVVVTDPKGVRPDRV
jgi:type IV secretion system protein VirD4